MNYGQNQGNIPTGSRLAQYMQAAPSNSNVVSQPSYPDYPYIGDSQPGIGPESTTQISYPFSQMIISGNRAPDPEIDDSVSAFLNSNYANSPSYFQNDELIPGDEDEGEDAYYLYQGLPLRVWKNRLKSQPRSAFFIDPNLKAELISHQLALQSSGPPVDANYPTTVENFHNVTQLSLSVKVSITPVPGRCMLDTVYRAVKSSDGQTYCLRRVSTSKPLTQKQIMSCENWKRINHSNIVQLREVVPTQAFNDFSYLFVYDFHPLAQPIKTYLFGKGLNESCSNTILPRCLPAGQKFGGLSELFIWSFVIQLSSAIRFIHSAGLAIRFLDLSRVLLCGKSKIYLSGCGIGDFQFGDGGNKTNIVAQQVEDLRNFGAMLLIMAVGRLNAASPENINNSLQLMEQNYSVDLRNLIQLMCAAKMTNHNLTTINEIMPMIGARFYGHIESLQLKNDFLEDELSKEMENGRLLRILCKLNTINDRKDRNMDPVWGETGDRYLLKLFNNYVFHQVSVNGKPWIDLSHISMCLNKLDAGVNENIQLVSHDGDNMLIVTYAELRKCLDSSFAALVSPQFSVAAPVSGVHRAGNMPMMEQMAGPHGDMPKVPGGLFVPSRVIGQTPNPQMTYVQPVTPIAKPKRPLVITEAVDEDKKSGKAQDPKQ